MDNVRIVAREGGKYHDLYIVQGGTLDFSIGLPDTVALPLAEYACRSQIRKKYKSDLPEATFTVTVEPPVSGDSVQLYTYYFHMSAANCALILAGESLTDEKSKHVWDAELYKTINVGQPDEEEIVIKAFGGFVYNYPEATKV